MLARWLNRVDDAAGRWSGQDRAQRAAGLLNAALLTMLLGVIVSYLTALPLEALLRNWSTDDSFYYAQTARNLATTGRTTFDGVNVTNGFHLLWLLLITPIYWLPLSQEEAVWLIKLLEIGLLGGALALASSLLIRERAGWYWLWPGVALYCRYPALLYGLEAAANLFAVYLLAWATSVAWRRPNDGRRETLLGLALAIQPLARLENVLLALLVLSVVAAVRKTREEPLPRRAAVWMVGTTSAFFLFNWIVYGSPVPISGRVKRWWADVEGITHGFDTFLANVLTLFELEIVRTGLLMGLAAVLWMAVERLVRRPRPALGALEALVAATFAFHLLKTATYAATSVPHWTSYQWYHLSGPVAASLSMAMFGMRVASLIGAWTASKLPGLPRWGRWVAASGWAVVVAGVAVDEARDRLRYQEYRGRKEGVEWRTASYHMAHWLDDNLPPGAVVGSFDCGVLGYFAKVRVVPLDGLINSARYLEALKEQRFEEFLRENQVTHVANMVAENKVDFAGYVRGKARQKHLRGTFQASYVDREHVIEYKGNRLAYQLHEYFAPEGS